MTRRLIALDLPGGDEFVTALRRAWDDGDAILPVDQRLPMPARKHLLTQLRPSAIVDADLRRTELPDGRPVEDGDALVVTTSGTTGVARGVVLTHDAVVASALATSARLEVADDDCWLACLPLSHIGGLSVICRALITDTNLMVHPGFEPAAVEASGATLVSLVATALTRIDPSRFRTILLGGGPAPLHRPINTVVTYGMTETGSGVVYDGIPLDGVEVAVDAHQQILLRCPMLARAYRGPDSDHPLDLIDGWYATGDLGSLNDGRLSVHGRRSEMIISGGENIWPAPIERILCQHPAIAEVAVVGRPDSTWGQAVTALLVLEDDAEMPELDELRELVRAELPAYCAPRHIARVERLARTTSGKIVRSELHTGD